MHISLLDELYFENATKEGLIDEVLELREALRKADAALIENAQLRRDVERLEDAKTQSVAKDKVINRLRRASGIKPRTSKRDVINMLESGVDDERIIEKLGVSKSTISRCKAILRG